LYFKNTAALLLSSPTAISSTEEINDVLPETVSEAEAEAKKDEIKEEPGETVSEPVANSKI